MSSLRVPLETEAWVIVWLLSRSFVLLGAASRPFESPMAEAVVPRAAVVEDWVPEIRPAVVPEPEWLPVADVLP